MPPTKIPTHIEKSIIDFLTIEEEIMKHLEYHNSKYCNNINLIITMIISIIVGFVLGVINASYFWH